MAAKDWSTRAGVVQKDSIVEAGKGIKATIVNKDGKPNTIGAYTEKSIAKIREVAETGEPVIVRGDLLGRGNTLHVAASYIKGQNEPAAEKGAKAPKADKPEMSDEEKAAAATARAEANRARALERDATRVPVKVGTVAEGDKLDVNGKEVEVTKLGAEFEVSENGKVDLQERFGFEFEVGDKVQYAQFPAEPEATNEPA